MAIDTFTKWIEAEPVIRITMEAAKRFMMRCVITRFRVPSQIITDNGKQFLSAKIQDFAMSWVPKCVMLQWPIPKAMGQSKE